jgi:hypothetical protein
MSAVEARLVQVKMKSSEGNLVYPNQLNEEFYSFGHSIEADAAPTESQEEIFKMLDGQLEEQAKAWSQIKNAEVAKINDLVNQADVPAISVSAAAQPSPTPTPPVSASPNETPQPTATPPH